MYKRIRSIDSVEAYEELLDDFIDRFGDFPDEVSALAEVGLIKHYANEIDVVSIKRKDNSVTITIDCRLVRLAYKECQSLRHLVR